MINGILTDIAKDELGNYLDSVDWYTKLSSVGSFGKVIFKVSSLGTLSPNNYKIDRAPKTKKHQIINNPDITEFQGRQLIRVSLGIKLIYSLTNIERARGRLTEYINEGHHFPLVLSGKKIGNNTFILTKYSEKVTKTDRIGTPLVVELDVSFEEYIEKINNPKELKCSKKE
ncbi:phage tail protein [Cetobacterium sp. 2A]|uniref:phage tail protein n=1 Tax=Cetobacterium sp. 2A TaxID=2754723 RepID=UPI00163B6EE7|nr:phage tail protein [Cetobacterium sp. 2A]MBC2855419.1 phage tail protein [Cetobacterium sp. 2A]